MSSVRTSRSPQPSQLDALLRDSLRRAVHASDLSIELIADRLTERLRRPIKAATIYAWMAETKLRWHLPADVIPHICEILGDDSIQRLLLSEKLKQSLELGESVPRVVALLQSALPEMQERVKDKDQKKSRRRANR